MTPFDYAKIGLGVLAGIAIAAVPACTYGKRLERQQARLEAHEEALERIQSMEKNNADFLALPARERCLQFMRDSGLPESSCER